MEIADRIQEMEIVRYVRKGITPEETRLTLVSLPNKYAQMLQSYLSRLNEIVAINEEKLIYIKSKECIRIIQLINSIDSLFPDNLREVSRSSQTGYICGMEYKDNY